MDATGTSCFRSAVASFGSGGRLLAVRAKWLPFPDDLREWLSPLVAILPAQLFVAALTAEKGMDPERPRGLNKVTLTR